MNNSLKLFVIGYGVEFFPESICERYTDYRRDNGAILNMAKIKRSDAAILDNKYDTVNNEYVFAEVLADNS